MSPTVSSSVSRAGIAESPSGERHIPSSVRPDGTVRKEIRVRPGYRPPEDVELYKNRTAEAWKNRGKGGVPGAESVASPANDAPSSAAAAKNAKRREARKKAAVTTTTTKDGAAPSEKSTKEPIPVPAAEAPVKELPADPEAEKAKEAKKLAKKLRQAQDLQNKKEKGDSLLPEQFQKVIKINELMRQLENLGFDTNGEKRAGTTEHEK